MAKKKKKESKKESNKRSNEHELDKSLDKKKEPNKELIGWLLFSGSLVLSQFLEYFTGNFDAVWLWMAQYLLGGRGEMDPTLAKILSMVFVGFLVCFVGAIFWLSEIHGKKIKSGEIKRTWGVSIIVVLWIMTAIMLAFIILTEKTVRAESTTPISTVTSGPTQTPVSTPTPASFDDLSWCVLPREKTHFPCKYQIGVNDWATKIAEAYYGNKSVAGQISELYRYDDGKMNNSYRLEEVIILPVISIPQDESYYKYYFQLLENPIQKCEGNTFSFPCWYVSRGETYNILREKYQGLAEEKCIEEANEVIYDGDKDTLVLKPSVPNAILVLPVCP